jgi:hypothetical protein
VAFGRLQIADVTEQRANKETSCCNKTPGDKDTVLTSERRPLWGGIEFYKINEKFNGKF